MRKVFSSRSVAVVPAIFVLSTLLFAPNMVRAQLRSETPEYAPVQSAPPAVAPPSYAPPQGGYEPGAQTAYPAQYQGYHPSEQGYAPPQQGQYPPGNYNSTPAFSYPRYPQQQPQYSPGYPQSSVLPNYSGGVSYAPQGLTIPISLNTAISTQVAKQGDYIQATIEKNVSLGAYSYIPSGSVATGQITESQAGRRLSRSGSLNIEFNNIRLLNGQNIPINAHLVGDLGKYALGKNDEYHGEGWKAKFGQFALRGLLGAGLGAGLGTGVGAIAGGGYGAGAGAWSGAAIGGGIGGLDMLLRKGRDVIIPSGTSMNLQLDAPINLPPGAMQNGAGPV